MHAVATPPVRAVARAAAAITFMAFASIAAAQHGGGAQPLNTRAPAEASQYDFLVGQWDVTATPQAKGLAGMMHGAPRLKGTWKGWRALEGHGVEDELRIVDASGNPIALTQFIRVYDEAARAWSVASVDAYRGAITTGTTRLTDGVMASAPGAGHADADGKTYMTRTRITDIKADAFTYLQERSYDGGSKWERYLKIEARRTAATAPR